MTVKATYRPYDRFANLRRRFGLSPRRAVVQALDEWHEEPVILFHRGTEATGPGSLKVAHGTSVFLSSRRQDGKKPAFSLTEYKQEGIDGIRDVFLIIADRDGPMEINLSYVPEKASGAKERR